MSKNDLTKRVQALQAAASLIHQSTFPAKACLDVVAAMDFLDAEYNLAQKELDALEKAEAETSPEVKQ